MNPKAKKFPVIRLREFVWLGFFYHIYYFDRRFTISEIFHAEIADKCSSDLFSKANI